MCELNYRACGTLPGAGTQVHAKVNWLSGLLVLALLLGLYPVRADEADDQYLQVYGLIQQADDLKANGKREPAKAKYLEAFDGLQAFKRTYPEWNPKLIVSRLKYLAQQAAALSEPPPAAVTNASTNAPETKPEAKPATPTSTGPLKLLGAGTGPRQALRLNPKPGDKQTIILNAKVGIDTKMGDQPPPFKLPSLTNTLDIPLDITVKDVSNKGDITYEVAASDAGGGGEPKPGAPQGARARKPAASEAKGVSATGTISSHGFSKELEFKGPPNADPQIRVLMDLMKDVFGQLTVPLPEEPVGVGAKWEVKAPIQSHGIKVEQTANYELVSIEGDSFKIKGTTTQRAAGQKIDNPIMPGTKVDLTKWSGKSSSELGLDANKVMASSGTMEMHTEIGMGIIMGPQSPSFTTKMDVNLRIESK
jgi:hypothetical protein